LHFHLKNSLTDEAQRGPECKGLGDFLRGWHNSICARFRSDCRCLGGVLPVFVIPFLISYFAVTGKWFNFADFFGWARGWRYLHAGHVSMYPFFRSACRYQSKAKCELCANLLHTQKYLLYCMAIKALHDWQAKWNIFWVIFCSWKCS